MSQLVYIFVHFIHLVWMLLFLYGWLLINARARYGIMYASVFFSTIVAWKVYDACPITLLENTLKNSNTDAWERWDLIGAFIFVFLLTTLYLVSAWKFLTSLPKGSCARYLRAKSLELVGVITVLSLVASTYDGPQNHFYLLANMSIGVIVAALGLWLNFGRRPSW